MFMDRNNFNLQFLLARPSQDAFLLPHEWSKEVVSLLVMLLYDLCDGLTVLSYQLTVYITITVYIALAVYLKVSVYLHS